MEEREASIVCKGRVCSRGVGNSRKLKNLCLCYLVFLFVFYWGIVDLQSFFFLFLFLFRAMPTAFGSSQARDWIGALAASLHHSHSNVGFGPSLQPAPQLTTTLDPSSTEWGQGSNPSPHGYLSGSLPLSHDGNSDLQSCVNFWYPAKWFHYIYIFFFIFFPIMVYYKILDKLLSFWNVLFVVVTVAKPYTI